MSLSAFWLFIGLAGIVSGTTILRSPPAVVNETLRYDNYAVYKLHINNKTQLAALKALTDNTNYNIWKEYDEISKDTHVMVNLEDRSFLNQMRNYEFNTEIMVPNVQALIDEEQFTRSTDHADDEFGWKRYYKLHEIEAWLDRILKAYPNITEGFSIGKSYEGRSIRGIKISYKANKANPGIFIESNIHAREWITSATATWFINQLLTSEKEEVRQLAENYDWYIIPVLNVDGFVYSHEKDRMWHKTRQSFSNSKCIGTDANRNFDSYWLTNNGASSDPCSNHFAGPKAFSEPETKALAEYIQSIKTKINIYLSFHSHGQYLLSPYGYTGTEFPSNYNDLQDISKAFVNAISNLSYKTKYGYGSIASAMYVASGTSIDWVYNTQDVKACFSIEFRDTGRFGFILPPVQILPNCEELMAGMLALVAKSKELGYV